MDTSYFVFSDYIHHAMLSAKFTKLSDGTFAGTIPSCQGVVAFGRTKAECSEKLHSALESWILLKLKMGHALPVIHGVNLNKEPLYESHYSL